MLSTEGRQIRLPPAIAPRTSSPCSQNRSSMMRTTRIRKLHHQQPSGCPYSFLLRWTWPDHIERALRQTMWAWLQEAAAQPSSTCVDSDYLGAHLCWLIARHPDTPAAVLDFFADFGGSAFKQCIAANPSTLPSTRARLTTEKALGNRPVRAQIYTPAEINLRIAANISRLLKRVSGH